MLTVFSTLAETTYNYSTSTDLSGAQAAGLGAFFGVFFLFWSIFVIVMLVAMWKVFVKAGQAGWKVLIPIYNTYVMLEIVGRPGWWLLLFFIPVVNFIVAVIVMLDLARAFGKDVLFAILALLLVSPIGMLILGFGKDKYLGPKPMDFGSGSGSTQPPAAPAAKA